MKLYHWTRPRNLLGVATFGLLPKPPYAESAHMTAGNDVIWLTANPSRDITEPADIEYLKEHPNFKNTWQFGEADNIRLTVKFNSTNRRHLFHWSEWIARYVMTDQKTGEDFRLAEMLPDMPPYGLRDFWVCLKRIPVSQIEDFPPITARIAMLGLEEGSEPYKALAAVSPDSLVIPGENSIRVYNKEAA